MATFICFLLWATWPKTMHGFRSAVRSRTFFLFLIVHKGRWVDFMSLLMLSYLLFIVINRHPLLNAYGMVINDLLHHNGLSPEHLLWNYLDMKWKVMISLTFIDLHTLVLATSYILFHNIKRQF